MATKAQIIEMAKDLTGRLDLDEQMASGITKGSFFLNAALRLLDTKQRTPESRRWLIKDIPKNESVLRFQNCRSIQEVWIINSDGRTQLEKKTPVELRENYAADPFTEGDSYTSSGIITFYPAVGTAEPYITDADSKFLDEGFGEGIKIKVTGSQSNNGVYDVIAATASTLTLHKSNSLVSESGTAGNVTITILTAGIETGTPLYYSVDSFHIAPQQRELTISDYEKDFSNDFYSVMFGSSQGYNGIKIMPPADAEYTVELLGDWFSVMEDDSDQCYWSIVYPNVLVQAILFAIEVFYRNTAGMNDLMLSLEPFLSGIDKDLAEESAVDINQMEG